MNQLETLEVLRTVRVEFLSTVRELSKLKRRMFLPDEIPAIAMLDKAIIELNGDPDLWLKSQIWPSLESIRLKCPKPLFGSDGFHWFYNDHETLEAMLQTGVQIAFTPIICKSCGLKLRLSVDADPP